MSSEEVAAATARREEIVNGLLELLTRPLFSTKELRHYQAVSAIFGVEPVVRELTGVASTLEGRTELLISVAMAALQIAIDSTPPAPSQRIIERREARRESREAERELKQSLAGESKPEVATSVNPSPGKL